MKNICSDSRRIRAGDVFAATHSGEEGLAHIRQAAEAGASAVVAEIPRPTEFIDAQIGWIHVKDARLALGLLSCAMFGWPSRKLDVYAVTGTNGKTTTAVMLRAVLSDNGFPAALISTIGSSTYPPESDNGLAPSANTTPGAIELQSLFSQAAANGCGAAVMEMSSHALDQERAAGTRFRAAGFTNLTRDHLDYHGSMEQYYAAKRRLFVPQMCPAAINADSPWGARLLGDILAAGGSRAKICTYGESPEADARLSSIRLGETHSEFDVSYRGRQYHAQLKVLGRHNIFNAMTAFSMAVVTGIPPEKALESLSKVPPARGRLEKIHCPASPASFFVDYAHTPDAIENLLRTLREISSGRIFIVFGAGGDRDRGKRPEMGRAAYKYADYLIVTSDNPRSEEPGAVIGDILSGLPPGAISEKTGGIPRVTSVISRRDAIRLAAKIANRPGDIVAVAGKGHETCQKFKTHTEYFDDAAEIAGCADLP